MRLLHFDAFIAFLDGQEFLVFADCVKITGVLGFSSNINFAGRFGLTLQILDPKCSDLVRENAPTT
jgi:hypothetical protein